jgi:ABC-type uncharacterized transport system substrate-binding protein
MSLKIKTPILACLLGLLLFSCEGDRNRKVLFVNSYHEGYPSSDDTMEGMKQAFTGKAVELEIFYMDTKRNPAETHIKAKVEEVRGRIAEFSPDVIIASDDNAVKYLVARYLDHGEIPVVFCGVNWSADQYRLGKHVTGMLEVSPLRECIDIFKRQNPGMNRLTVLSENTTSERNNTILLDTLYRNLGFDADYRLVDDFEQWKTAFREVSANTHIIFLPTNGAIRGWDREAAMHFVEEEIRVPVITCDDFMMDYAVFGLTKVFTEQGEWAALTALKILEGTPPASIPVTRNQRFKAYLNRKLAEHLCFELPEFPPGELIEIR